MIKLLLLLQMSYGHIDLPDGKVDILRSRDSIEVYIIYSGSTKRGIVMNVPIRTARVWVDMIEIHATTLPEDTVLIPIPNINFDYKPTAVSSVNIRCSKHSGCWATIGNYDIGGYWRPDPNLYPHHLKRLATILRSAVEQDVTIADSLPYKAVWK